jgi:adenine-specific DNA-methyltransferase
VAEDLNKLSKEELIEYINSLRKQLSSEKYGLYFDRKATPEDVVEKCKTNIPFLEHIANKDILTDKTNKKYANNVLIEGDNFEVLSTLNMIYPNGVADVIYIDPPYNTGNNDFTYNDNFVDNSDSYRHTKWLNFMEKRLKLAKELLKDEGMIFISIDDNEFAQLKLLCDAIFGNQNYLTDFIWINNLKGRQISVGGAVKTYEHIILYCKDVQYAYTFSGNIKELQGDMPLIYKSKEYEPYEDERGKYIIKNELYNTNSAFNEETRPNLVFNIWYNSNTDEIKFTNINEEDISDLDYIKITPHRNADGEHLYHAWRWSKEKIINEQYNLLFQDIDGKTYKIFTKIRDIYSTNIKDIITDSTNGNSELNDIIGKGLFSYPKPVKLIKRLISFSENKNSVVLDFFAGSGTTAQAVLELNKEQEDSNRTFIITTLNEVSDAVLTTYLRTEGLLPQKSTKKQLSSYKLSNEYQQLIKSDDYFDLGIINRVTYERIKRILNGTAKKGKYNSTSLTGNLRFFRTRHLESASSKDQNKYNLVEKVNGLLCFLEDSYDEFDKGNGWTIYSSNDKSRYLGIFTDYFSENEFSCFLNHLKDVKGEIIIYSFSLDNNVDKNIEEIVEENLSNAIVKAIPTKIYEIYRKIIDDVKRDY